MRNRKVNYGNSLLRKARFLPDTLVEYRAEGKSIFDAEIGVVTEVNSVVDKKTGREKLLTTVAFDNYTTRKDVKTFNENDLQTMSSDPFGD